MEIAREEGGGKEGNGKEEGRGKEENREGVCVNGCRGKDAPDYS